MCGIAGQWGGRASARARSLQTNRALAMLRHRGPDQFGIYADPRAALGSARLSIVDLGHGRQPIANEDESLWIVCNGEIFNHVELRPQLEARGHRFRTGSDTEVVLHLFEDSGPDGLGVLNGQFALAIWNRREGSLFLARDRLGVRPLFLWNPGDRLIFASEIKALLTHREIAAELDPVALGQIFTFWSPLSPRTLFRGIEELRPGHYLIADEHGVRSRRYWRLQFPVSERPASCPEPFRNNHLEEATAQFRDLLVDAARIRLRADVEVGAYLSGGLDSSAIASIVRHHTRTRLRTFSIAFTDTEFDESEFQTRMATFLGTEHQVLRASHADIGRVFPEVIWHTEVPILRTAPAPMFLLAQQVHHHGLKVVLTGEGADEFLAGYDIFKEAAIRRFWARQPRSPWRPALLRRLYPEIARLGRGGPAFLSAFFRPGLEALQTRDYSHAVRWRNTRRLLRLFSADLRAQLPNTTPGEEVDWPADFDRWAPLHQAQSLEIEIFLSQYLLSSQGDRMGMAHAVEGRFPFLDPRIIDFCSGLPPAWKLRGLTEKFLLREATAPLLPPEIRRRRKRPYRAPIHRCFFDPPCPDYLDDLLSATAIRHAGLFDPAAVAQLVAKARSAPSLGETEDMAVAGVISTQLWHTQFVRGSRGGGELTPKDDLKVVVQESHHGSNDACADHRFGPR